MTQSPYRYRRRCNRRIGPLAFLALWPFLAFSSLFLLAEGGVDAEEGGDEEGDETAGGHPDGDAPSIEDEYLQHEDNQIHA